MVITKDFDSFNPGSSPGGTSRIFCFFPSWGPEPVEPADGSQGLRVHSSAVERRIADPEVAGSIPVAPCNFFLFFIFPPPFIFQVACPFGLRVHSSVVERRIADPEVAGSNPVAPCHFGALV